MYTIPTIQHLRNVRLTMAYRELPENEAQLARWSPAEVEDRPGTQSLLRVRSQQQAFHQRRACL